MNAEQLHTIASEVLEDIESAALITRFDRLRKTLDALTANPGDEGSQKNVSTAREELYSSLDHLDEARWSAGVRQTIEELGGAFLVSETIRQEIEEEFLISAMTPAVIRDKVGEFNQQLREFNQHLTELKAAFEALNIEEEPLEPGEVELGVLIPREHIESRLSSLAVEAANLDEIFKHFSVVATGTREEFEVTYLSASDLKLFLRPDPKTALIISATVTFILSSLNGIADLKIKYDEIMQAGIEEARLTGLQEAINEKLEKDLEKFRVELLDEFSKDVAEHDRNENDARLKIAISHLAPRLERGFAIEIRVGALPEPEEDGDEAGDEYSEDEVELVDRLKDDARQLKRLEPIGSPILSLPDPEWFDKENK